MTIFDSIYQDGATIVDTIGKLEHKLDLEAGFLTEDILVQEFIELMPKPQNKPQMLQSLIEALKDIKVIAYNSKQIYGDFNDNYDLYEDDQHNTIEKTFSMPELDESEDDFDDTASLMETHKRMTSISSLESSPLLDFVEPLNIKPKYKTEQSNYIEDETINLSINDSLSSICSFDLNDILQDLDTKHESIDFNFQILDLRLSNLEISSITELKDLNRMLETSNVVDSRLKYVREGLECFQYMNKNHREVEKENIKPVINEKVHPFNLIDSVLTEKDIELMERLRTKKELKIKQEEEADVASPAILFITLIIILFSYYISV